MKLFQRVAAPAGIIVWAALLCVACVNPKRVALKSPFALTYGSTTIPANGVAVGVEYGSGLAGQELERAAILNLNLGIGLLDRVSVSAAAYGGTESGDPFDEQRSPAGCIGVQNGALVSGLALSVSRYARESSASQRA